MKKDEETTRKGKWEREKAQSHTMMMGDVKRKFLMGLNIKANGREIMMFLRLSPKGQNERRGEEYLQKSICESLAFSLKSVLMCE